MIEDKITEDLRQKVVDRFGEPSESKVSYLAHCPWCVSIYVGLGVSAARMIAPKAAEPILEGLAYSALTGIMAEREDSF